MRKKDDVCGSSHYFRGPRNIGLKEAALSETERWTPCCEDRRFKGIVILVVESGQEVDGLLSILFVLSLQEMF